MNSFVNSIVSGILGKKKQTNTILGKKKPITTTTGGDWTWDIIDANVMSDEEMKQQLLLNKAMSQVNKYNKDAYKNWTMVERNPK